MPYACVSQQVSNKGLTAPIMLLIVSHTADNCHFVYSKKGSYYSMAQTIALTVRFLLMHIFQFTIVLDQCNCLLFIVYEGTTVYGCYSIRDRKAKKNYFHLLGGICRISYETQGIMNVCKYFFLPKLTFF